MIILDVLGGYWFRGSRTGFYGPETACHEKIVLKIKSIVMRTTNNLFRKVHNYTHFMGWFTQFERKCNILEIFHYFQYFERFRSMKKWQISKPKIVHWYLDFTKESYTTLKSVISSFKICLNVTKQSNAVTSNGVTRKRVTRKKFNRLKKWKKINPIERKNINRVRQ